MKKIVCLLAVIFLVAASPEAPKPLALKPQTEFMFDLYRTVVKDAPDTNVLVSPYGVQWMLDLVRTGADGTTKTEIERVLGYTESVKWESVTDGTLTTAAALWGQKNYPFLPEFIRTAQSNFGSTVEQADFRNNPAAAVRQINAWSSKQTKGKIPTIFDRLGPDTRLVLVNAIYFKADWNGKFDKKRTQDEDFTLQNGVKIKTMMMKRTGQMWHAETDDTLFLTLPYKKNGYAMLILMPKNAKDFAKWEMEMTAEKIEPVRNNLRLGEGEIWMPRFTAENTIELIEPLKRLGAATVFSPGADLSKMDGTKLLFVDNMLQKTFIAVDESGTTAATVTGGGIGCSAPMRPEPYSFYMDRPFLYAIVKDDTILFMGRFVNPKLE